MTFTHRGIRQRRRRGESDGAVKSAAPLACISRSRHDEAFAGDAGRRRDPAARRWFRGRGGALPQHPVTRASPAAL